MDMNIGTMLKQIMQRIPYVIAVRKSVSAWCDLANATHETDSCGRDLSEMEYVFGAHLVRHHRALVKSRFKTISNSHRISAPNKTCTEWVCEARALARYFEKRRERDSEAAISLLMPFELQYQRARYEQLHCKPRSKPTVGQAGHIHASHGVGQP